MERQRNWPGWAALLLAGLALFVALGGRSPFSNVAERAAPWVEPPRAAPAAPDFRERADALREEFRQGRFDGERRVWSDAHPRDFFGPPWYAIFWPLKLLFGLAQLVALGLLIWLLFRLFSQRRSQPPGGPQPTAGAPYDPRVD